MSGWPAVVKRPVRLTVSWSVAPAEARPISRTLHALLDVARSEPGWLHGSLQTTLSDYARLTYREEWQTENDLRRQVRSPRFDRLLELMDRASREPKLRVQLPSAIRGLDYVIDLRGSRRP